MKQLLEKLLKESLGEKYLSNELMKLDGGPDGMRTIRSVKLQGNDLTINCLAGSPVTGYLNKLLKSLGLNCKFINKTVGPGDHDYHFEVISKN